MDELINELKRIKKQFLYHKAIVGYIPPDMPKSDANYEYFSGGYYHTKALVKILENGLSREEHNEASHSVNQWFIVYCSEIIKDKMNGVRGFKKIRNKDKKPLNEFSNCQLLYILRDKLAHGLYRPDKIGKDLFVPYLADDVSQEIRNRYKFDESLDTNNIYSLPVDKVVIPLIDACIEEINKIKK